jgi:cell division cycle 14
MELIPDRLYFYVGSTVSLAGFSFSIDKNSDFQYTPFFGDFGPPSILMIHRFNSMVDTLFVTHPDPVYYHCSSQPNRLANGVMFISAFLMMNLQITPAEAIRPFSEFTGNLKTYRDASPLPQSHTLRIITCLEALAKAQRLGWYNPLTFDAADWLKYEAVPAGDMNWIIPGKILAFATPYPTNIIQGSWRVATPRDLVPVFLAKGITAIVRLCEPFYSERVFTKAGFHFYHLVFDDGSTPPISIREDFLRLCESDEVLAVHCKAGLGRTYFSFLIPVGHSSDVI